LFACSAPTNGAEVVAQRLEQVARGQTASGAVLYNPMTHLRDTVVFGYLMASPKNGRVDVPDWYDWLPLLDCNMDGRPGASMGHIKADA